jgi:hypothetical protein
VHSITTEKEKKKMLEAMDEGKAYSHVKKVEQDTWGNEYDFYALPNVFKNISEIKKVIKSIFDNCTIIVRPDDILSTSEIKCQNTIKNKKIFYENMVFHIQNGEILDEKSICNRCTKLVESLVGECSSRNFQPEKEEYNLKNRRLNDKIKEYTEIPSGYVKQKEFSNEIDFSKEHVKERMDYYSSKGQWRKKLNRTRKEVCHDCIKYRTHTCSKGWNGIRLTSKCHFTKKEMIDKLKKECLEDFGSLGRALWYFSQCGQVIKYKDPITKRKSKRFISVPGHPDGKSEAKGFFMSFVNYPYEIGDYGERDYNPYRSKINTTKKHENYMSEYEYRKYFEDIVVDTRIKKSLEELALTAYAVYRYCGSRPGQSYYMSSYANYMTYIGINRNMVEVGLGASHWKCQSYIKDLKGLFDATVLPIEK